MKRKIHKLTAFILILSLTVSILPSFSAADAAGPSLTSRGAFILDFQTGQEIWSYNGDTPLVPASMTKVMTVYLVYEAMESGVISKDTAVPISDGVAEFSRNFEYSNIILSQYSSYTVDEILAAVICYSACAATTALAELISGSEEAFLVLMNDKAAELGLEAHYFDCFGGSERNSITPRSMAYLACRLIQDYPDYLNYSSKATFRFHGRTFSATNSLLRDTYDFPGTADGIKTGTTDAAGACLCASVVKDGHRIITVTMHSSTGANRYYDSVKLIKYGFNYIDGRLSQGYRYVSPCEFDIYVNGQPTNIAAYLIDDSNYFRLRDLAYVLSDTPGSFEVTYDEGENAVIMSTGAAYTPLGTELGISGGGQALALANSPLIYADGEKVELNSYLIDENNYVKLRDVAGVAGFEVYWDDESRSVHINSPAA